MRSRISGEAETKISEETLHKELQHEDMRNVNEDPHLDFLQRALTTRSEARHIETLGTHLEGARKHGSEANPTSQVL